MREDADTARNAIPIACNLSGPGLAKRRRELSEDLFSRVSGVEELEDGYAFGFPGDNESTLELMSFVDAERKCCPFFSFELVFEPGGGPISLRVRGPKGAKDIIEEMAALQSR